MRLHFMLIRVFMLLVSALLFSGCVNSYNVSKKQPFCDYVGRTVPLQRPALVVHSLNELGGGGRVFFQFSTRVVD